MIHYLTLEEYTKRIHQSTKEVETLTVYDADGKLLITGFTEDNKFYTVAEK